MDVPDGCPDQRKECWDKKAIQLPNFVHIERRLRDILIRETLSFRTLELFW